MNKKVFTIVLSFIVLCANFFVSNTNAQRTKSKTTKVAATNKTTVAVDPLLAALPKSDAVVSIDVKRLLNDFVPKLLSESPEKLAAFNAQLDKIKAQTGGLDVRQFEKIVAGFRFLRTAQTKSSPAKLNVETVMLVKSSFNADMLIAGGKMVAKGKFKEEKFAGKTITLFDLTALKDKAAEAVKEKTGTTADPNTQSNQNETLSFVDKIANVILGKDLSQVAVVSIDDKTLAIGKLTSVKSALSAKTGKVAATNAAINELAMKNPNAIVSFGGNVPSKVSELLEVENDFAKQLDAIKQLFGSVGMSETNYELVLTARAIDAANAKNIFDVLQFFKQFGSGFLQNRTDDLSKIGVGLLGGLQARNEGKDVHLKIEMKQSDVNGLLKLF